MNPAENVPFAALALKGCWKFWSASPWVRAKIEDIDLLENLAVKIKDSSLCGLGQTAPNPVLTTLKYFREEYEAHIIDKRCPAHSCTALLTYTINADNCTGCTVCATKCPVNAISGIKRKYILLIRMLVSNVVNVSMFVISNAIVKE